MRVSAWADAAEDCLRRSRTAQLVLVWLGSGTEYGLESVISESELAVCCEAGQVAADDDVSGPLSRTPRPPANAARAG